VSLPIGVQRASRISLADGTRRTETPVGVFGPGKRLPSFALVRARQSQERCAKQEHQTEVLENPNEGPT
jgi:hypothetical protein